MKAKIFIIILIIIFIAGCTPEKMTKTENPIKEKSTGIILSILYDNTVYDEKLNSGWGFGCLAQIDGKNILFDTGSDSPTLLSNMQKLDIDPKIVDIVVLSHIHGDHIGGLLGFLKQNSDVKVYVPGSFPADFKDQIRSAGAEFIDISGPTKIMDNVYSTGELGTWIKEQSLVIDTDKGLIVVTGCAHPGIVKIIEKAKELHDKKVHLVIGGFHSPPLSVVQEFKVLGVEKVCPCHCTGSSAIGAFEKEYKKDYIQGGAGRIIKI